MENEVNFKEIVSKFTEVAKETSNDKFKRVMVYFFEDSTLRNVVNVLEFGINENSLTKAKKLTGYVSSIIKQMCEYENCKFYLLYVKDYEITK